MVSWQAIRRNEMKKGWWNNEGRRGQLVVDQSSASESSKGDLSSVCISCRETLGSSGTSFLRHRRKISIGNRVIGLRIRSGSKGNEVPCDSSGRKRAGVITSREWKKKKEEDTVSRDTRALKRVAKEPIERELFPRYYIGRKKEGRKEIATNRIELSKQITRAIQRLFWEFMKLVKRTDEIHEESGGEGILRLYTLLTSRGASEIRCEVYSISNSFR